MGTRLLTSFVSGVALAACGVPGIRPEGRTQALTGSAPAGAAVVFDRAKEWFPANRYVLADEMRDNMLRGYRIIGQNGTVETRVVIEFTIARIDRELTSYHIESQTQVGTPPALRQADSNAPEAVQAVGSLQSWLSCSAALWPGCP